MKDKKEKTESVELVEVEKVELPQAVSIDSFIATALGTNVPIETMERLFALKERYDAQVAKTAFDNAISAFQKDCPTIKKTKTVNTNAGARAYSYAPIESIVEQVKELLANCKLSYSFKVEITEKGVKVTCIAKHAMGHSETSEMEVPLGAKTNVMSDSQVTAAATTFAKRYAFCNVFGIMTGDEDTDARDTTAKKAEPKPKSVKAIIMAQLKKLGVTDATRDGITSAVQRLTGIELTDDDSILEEVSARLSVLVEEKESAG